MTLITKFETRDKSMVSAITKWAEGKPLLISMTAIELAFDAEYCFECAEQIKKKEGFIYDFPVPPLNEWLSLYKNHHRVFNLFNDTFVDSDGLVESVKDLTELISDNLRIIKKEGLENIREEIKNLTEEEKEDIFECSKEFQKDFEKLYEMHQKAINSDINGEKDKELENKIKRDLGKPEIKFMLQVFSPCFILYRCFPIKLLRKARKGNIKAIEMLIRLDSSIEFDKKIAEFLHLNSNNKHINDLLNAARTNGINEKVTRKKIKINTAGLISYITMKFGKKLNEREIRNLFDAIAKDKGVCDIDTDIPDGADAFSRAIRRERKDWESSLNNSHGFI